MATSDQAADLLQKLSLDPKTKSMDQTKKSGVDGTNGQIQSFDRSLTPDFVDPNFCYLPAGYYYGGYETGANEWDEYARYMNPDGVDLSAGVYGENGSLMYHNGYGYAPYSPYAPAVSPVPTVGQDGQLYGSQHYQYPTPYFQPMTQTSGPYPSPTVPPKGENVAPPGQKPSSVETTNGNSNISTGGVVKGNNGLAPVRSTYQNSSYNTNGSYGKGGTLPGGMAASGYQDHRYGYDGLRSPVPWLDGPTRPVTNASITPSISNGNGLPSKNQNLRPYQTGFNQSRPTSGINSSNGYMSRMYSNKLYGQYGSTYRTGLGYGSNAYDSRSNGYGWLAVDSKYKPRARGNGFYGYGNENMDGLNELNRGPRAKSSKNLKGFTPITLAVKGQGIILPTTDEEKDTLVPDREQYNKLDFPEHYADAKFYIIKSYSEDDVHKSIKYNVWASTSNGNKKLDAAYQEAQQKPGGCPIFLLFSVNTSGQFVGVAEMTGSVDFDKTLEYWQQDKWLGCFPVKWHIVKDVPNSLLKHITLENNENKPVTNSRDTQEVRLDQGLQLLKIFKDHSSKQCILDDFDFYEDRQKRIQEKKAKQQQFQKQMQVWEGKAADDKNKDGANVEAKVQKPAEVVSELIKESSSPVIQSNGDVKLSENGSGVKPSDLSNGTKPVLVSEKKIVANGC